MLFGDPAVFAVEVALDLDAPLVGRSLAGRLQIHIGGVALGDFNEPLCTLGPVADHLTEIGANSSRLWHPSLQGLSPEGIFNLLDGALYTGTADMHPPEFDRMEFLTNRSEAFDDLKGFVVRDQERALRLMVWDCSSSRFSTWVVPHAALSTTASAFVAWIRQQEQALRGRE
jgi:hypothetical protein